MSVPEPIRIQLIRQVMAEGKADSLNLGDLDDLLRLGALAVSQATPDGRCNVQVSPELYAMCRKINRRPELKPIDDKWEEQKRAQDS